MSARRIGSSRGVLCLSWVALLIAVTSCRSSTPQYSTAQAGLHRARFLQRHGDQLSGEQRRLIKGLPYSSSRSVQSARMQSILQGPQGIRVSGGKLVPGRHSVLGMQDGELGQRKGVRIIEIGPTPREGEDVSPVEKQGNANGPDSEEFGEDPTSDSSGRNGDRPEQEE